MDVVNSLYIYRVSACSPYQGSYSISFVYIHPPGGLSSPPLQVTVKYLIMLALNRCSEQSLYIKSLFLKSIAGGPTVLVVSIYTHQVAYLASQGNSYVSNHVGLRWM